MTAVVTLLSAGEAQRLTQRIKLTAGSIRDGLFKLRNLVDEAQASNAWQVLGYASWTSYLADVLGSEPMRLSREDRQELVAYLSGEGMSTRAIAPIVGVDQKTVVRDIAREANASPAESVSTAPEAAEPVVTGPVEQTPDAPRPVTDNIAVNPSTGEVVDAPVTVTETHTVKTVTGLDGKTYQTKPRTPKPVLAGDDLAKYDAEQAAIAVGRALTTFDAMRTPAHRARVIGWWPTGNDAVPPDSRALFEPTAIRDIASALLQLADELEIRS